MIRTFKCSGCGGDLIYEAGTDHLVCPHCRKTTSFAELKYDTDLNVQAADEAVDNAGNRKKEYHCVNCGAPLTADDYTAATFCKHCGSPMLIESRFTGDGMPSRILPFAFDKKQAQTYFKTWKGTGFLTPSSFKSSATMDKVRGEYVPYWLYDYTAEVSIDAEGQRNHVERRGDQETVTTEHFQIQRITEGDYDNVPGNAHQSLPSDKLSVLEPFDFTALKPFAAPFMAGFYADHFAKSAEELEPEVREKVTQDALENAVAAITGYDTVEVEHSKVDVLSVQCEYTMLPVWVLNFNYGGKNYPLYMNGQSGKIEGELPISKGKLLLIGLIFFVIAFLITFFLGRGL